ncbi:uveal autoantigen with coiled-coil domains and ankyrin repeats-like isoform X1 [Procambarus clarkii]|uniref:uveal autoantigen with coiled-coil domains and ankyrin repeats-like isoform X1 n=1 Tax=Procambarus clarkii TaxID=6728 RepID=UPI0037431A5B
MKKLKRVFGSVTNLASGRNDDQSTPGNPGSSVANTFRSTSTSPHRSGSPQKGSYYSYETQSLDSFNSGVSTAITQVDPHSKQDKNFTKLHKWAYLGDTNKLKKFVKKVSVDAQDSEGKTALHHAAAQGHGDAVLFLLGSKSNVEMKDNIGMTPFLRAVERAQLQIVQLFLQRRVDIKVTDYQRNNCSHLAARTGATDLLTLLLDCDSDYDAPNSLGRTPLHIACSENQEEAVEALLRHGASVNVSDKEGVTPLMVAAKLGSVSLVESLIDHGADLSRVDASKWSAADYARFTNHNQLYNHLKTLMKDDGSSSVIAQGLLNVSDDGSAQDDDGAVGLTSANKHSHCDGTDNSWSDSSDINSIKEKPKLNLTKFLPSSDESAGNLFATITTPEGSRSNGLGPPKPPRLHTSSSSIASENVDAKAEDICSDKEGSLKADDSWKSSSDEEDKEPKLKPFELFKRGLQFHEEVNKEEKIPNDDIGAVSHSRTSREDMLAELGLNDLTYQSSEDVSFSDEEKPVLPLEGTPKKNIISRRSSMLPEDGLNVKVSPSKTVSHSSAFQTSFGDHAPLNTKRESPAKQMPEQCEEVIKTDLSLNYSPQTSARKSRKHSALKESLRKSPLKKSPRNASTKSRLERSFNFDSDSDDELISSQRPRRRKNSTPTKGKLESKSSNNFAAEQIKFENVAEKRKLKSLGDESSVDSNSDDAPLSSLGKKEESVKSQQSEKRENLNTRIHSKSLETDSNNVGGSTLSLLATNAGSSCTNTLSTVVGTLGRVGTMHETEEVWEANASISQHKYSSSNSSLQNSGNENLKEINGHSGRDTDTLPECINKKGVHTAQGNGNGIDFKIDVNDLGSIDETTSTRNVVESEDTGHISNDILEANPVNVVSPRSSSISVSGVHSSELSATRENGDIQTVKEKLLDASIETFSHAETKNSVSTKENLLTNPMSITKIAENIKLTSNQKVEKNKPVEKSNERSVSRPPSNLSALSKPHCRTGSGSGLCSIAFSDEDSIAHDPLSTPRGLDELDDGISAASTETEESTHINSGLKDSLLNPLSSLPDASDVAQLQDLVRELRLKLEKEFGRRAALETRVSNLQQQEKQSKHYSDQQELDLQRQQQEVSTLAGRIRQLEYQSRCEQDSSRLKEQSLEDFQSRCTQLEEQCSTLRVHAQHQEQLVDSLMVQLQTKERINQSLQGKLEELTSQTKYVSMKSCQTEAIYMNTGETVATCAQTDIVFFDRKESATQTNSTSTSVDVRITTDKNMQNSAAELKELNLSQTCNSASVSIIKTVTDSILPEESNSDHRTTPCMMDEAVQTEGTYSTNVISAQVQCTPERLIKSCQTQICTQTQSVQTSMEGLCGSGEKAVNDSSSQTVTMIRQAAIQTDTVTSDCDSESSQKTVGESSQVQLIASAVEPILQTFSHDLESLIIEKNETSQTSVLEMIKQIIIGQIDKLECIINTSLQQTSSFQNRETQCQLSEGILHLQELLQNQLDTVTKMSDDVAGIKCSYLKDSITEVNSDIQSRFQNLREELDGLHQSQVSSEQVMINISSSLGELKQNNDKFFNCISEYFQESRDSRSYGYNDMKQHFETHIGEVKKTLELSKCSDDSGVSDSLTRGIIDKLETLQKSFTMSVEKSCTVQDIYEVQDGIKKMSDDIQNKVSELEQSLQTANKDTRLDQTQINELMNTIKESNKQLMVLLKTRTSEANSNISEALEENFHIIQDHLHRLQQTVLKRINEVCDHVNIAEDEKVVWLSKQVMEMASQVSGMKSGILRVQSSMEATQSLPSSSGIIDEVLISSLKASNEQAVSTLKFQNQSIIQQLEVLQKEIHSTIVQGQISKDNKEVCALKEALNEKENELAKLTSCKENLQEKLQQQTIKMEYLKCKEEEQQLKIESVYEKLHYFESVLKEKDEEIHQAAIKNVSHSEDTAKVRQENFRLTSENGKLSSMLQAEQRQHQWYESELQSLREAKEVAEAKARELMTHLQQTSLERTPPTGRDDDDDNVRYSKQEIKKLELEKQEAETCYNEQQNRSQRLELQLKEVEVALRLEKSNKEELEKLYKKSKDSLNFLEHDLSNARQNQETIQELEDHIRESEIEIKSRDMAVEALKKKLEAANKEKLDLKQAVMLLKSEKLTYELIKQEKELAEQMQKKTEEQLHQIQRKIPLEYVSKASLQLFQKEIENKYNLELSAKLAELNQVIEEQNKQQESQAKSRGAREQALENELGKKSEEIIRLRAQLSIHDEREDTWRVRHDRLMALYQHQAQTNHNHVHRLTRTQKPHEESLSISLQEIDNHLKKPFAASTFLGQLTPPSSLLLPKAPSNIDSYHYTHSDFLERTLHKYLDSADKPRYVPCDDKPQARISPMQPLAHSLKHERLPSLDQSCEDYVELLKKKYGF